MEYSTSSIAPPEAGDNTPHDQMLSNVGAHLLDVSIMEVETLGDIAQDLGELFPNTETPSDSSTTVYTALLDCNYQNNHPLQHPQPDNKDSSVKATNGSIGPALTWSRWISYVFGVY
jgi:hypothetical protein